MSRAAAAFSLVCVLAALAGLVAFSVIWRRRFARAGRPLALMLLSAAFRAICDAIELHVPTDYLASRQPVEFTHAICPECVAHLYLKICAT